MLDTTLGKPSVFRSEESRWQEWYVEFREYIMCSGDRYPDLVTAVEDPAQGTMDTTRWDPEQIQVSRHLCLILVMLTEDAALRIVQAVHDSSRAEALGLMYRRYNPLTQGRMLAKLNEVLQVDLGTDERAYMDNVVQWKQRIHECENVTRNFVGHRHKNHHHRKITSSNQTTAAIEAFLTVGRKWGQIKMDKRQWTLMQ